MTNPSKYDPEILMERFTADQLLGIARDLGLTPDIKRLFVASFVAGTLNELLEHGLPPEEFVTEIADGVVDEFRARRRMEWMKDVI